MWNKKHEAADEIFSVLTVNCVCVVDYSSTRIQEESHVESYGTVGRGVWVVLVPSA